MNVLIIDDEIYGYPEDMSCFEDFVDYVKEHYYSFIMMTHYRTENCVYPYLISDDTEQLFMNIAAMQRIGETKVTVLSRAEYDARLEQVMRKKCINCINYTEDTEGDNLAGHRETLSLDGDCDDFVPIDR